MRFLLRRLFLGSNLTATRPRNIRLKSTSASDPVNKPESEPAKPAEEIVKNITIEKFGPITTLNIDRQKCRNSLDEATLRQMTAAINEFDKDDQAKVLIFNGEGGTFSAGFDLDEIGEKGYNTLKDAAHRLMKRPLCDKVTIAAVAGYAVGEGFELAIACDLRIIEDTAILGCLGRRYGVPQSLFGARRLTSLIGLSPALDLLITGRLINGVEAHRIGLACKLTSTGTALGEAIKLAKSLVKFPQNALTMDKMAAVNSQLNPNSEESMRDEAIMQSLLGNAIEDMKEGVKKFQAEMDESIIISVRALPSARDVVGAAAEQEITNLQTSDMPLKIHSIGKHGKFYKLTEMPLKDWEIEETFEEVTVESPTEAKDPKKD